MISRRHRRRSMNTPSPPSTESESVSESEHGVLFKMDAVSGDGAVNAATGPISEGTVCGWSGYAFWRRVGRPALVCAPMVHQSEVMDGVFVVVVVVIDFAVTLLATPLDDGTASIPFIVPTVWRFAVLFPDDQQQALFGAH